MKNWFKAESRKVLFRYVYWTDGEYSPYANPFLYACQLRSRGEAEYTVFSSFSDCCFARRVALPVERLFPFRMLGDKLYSTIKAYIRYWDSRMKQLLVLDPNELEPLLMELLPSFYQEGWASYVCEE